MTGLIIDNFAGGGGASTGIEAALGRPVDIAINHDEAALLMHAANHPGTWHYRDDVWSVDPRRVTGGRAVDLAWFSPDCTHHSKAKGGKPLKKNIRALAWVVLKWAALTRPEVIILENVEEFQKWGPLTRSRRPCKRRAGMTFARWVGQLEDLGYRVEWRELRACDYGAPTIRKRIFVVARRAGPVVWPAPTHGPGLLPYRTAAECIDWSIPCPSIFERKRPLAEATMRRIARGVRRYVIEAAEPFIIRTDMQSAAKRNGVHGLHEPLNTVTTGGGFAVVAPSIMTNTTGHPGSGVAEPLRTVTTGGHHALVAAFLSKYHGIKAPGEARGRQPDLPFATLDTQNRFSLVASHLIKLRGTCRDGQDLRQPMPTVTAGGTHVGEVRAFLMKYYGTGGQWQDCRDPMHTMTAKARLGLVTVAGEDWCIADIGMRMLTPRELYRAQGFPETTIIDPARADGRPLTKTAQVSLCGNSVCPPLAEALVAANCADVAIERAA